MTDLTVDVPSSEPSGSGASGERPWVVRAATLVLAAAVGIVRDFVVQVFREGVIRLRGLSPAVKAVVGCAMALTGVAMAALIWADRWRDRGPLLPRTPGQIGRGTLIPEAVVPFTLVMLAAGSALILAGALRAMKPLRFLVLIVFTSLALIVRSTGDRFSTADDWRHWTGWAGIVVVLVVYAVAWRFRARPALELAVLFGATAAVFAAAGSQLTEFDRYAGSTLGTYDLDLVVFNIRDLTLPLVFAAGLGVVAFAITATGWVIDFVDRSVPALGASILLAGLLLWRAHDLLPELWDMVTGSSADGTAGGYLGAVGLIVVVAGVQRAVQLQADRAGPAPAGILTSHLGATDHTVEDDELEIGMAASKVALPLAAVFSLTSLVIFAMLQVTQAITTVSLDLGTRTGRWNADVAEALSRQATVKTTQAVVAGLLVVAAGFVARRGRRVLALYVGIVAAVFLYDLVTLDWSGFRAMSWTGAQLDQCWFLVLAGLAATWAAQGRLSADRAERLLFATLLAALIRESDFISDPFSLVLGFTGIGFVVFGLVWGFLTAGGWANETSRAFPRTSRVFLYLGYSLAGITLLAYFTATHQVSTATLLTTTHAANGFGLLGLPLVYAIEALLISGALVDRPLQRTRRSEAEPAVVTTEEPAAPGDPEDRSSAMAEPEIEA